MTDMRKVEFLLEELNGTIAQATAEFSRANDQLAKLCDTLVEQNREDRIRAYRSELPRHQG